MWGTMDMSRSWQDGSDNTCNSRVVSAIEEKVLLGERTDNEELGCQGGTTLDVPVYHVTSPGWEYAALKQRGDEWLQQVVTLYDDVLLPAMKDNEMFDVQELWGYSSDVLEPKLLLKTEKEAECLEVQLTLLEPQRIQCGWCETRRPGRSLMYDESSKILQKAIRGMDQMKLLLKEVVVLDVFEGDWGRGLYGICSTNDADEIQQLLLPYDIVRNDEARVLGAPSKIVSLANDYLHDFQRTDISLTKASMNIPCVWSHTVARNGLANLVAEKLKEEVTPPKLATSSTRDSVSLPVQDNDANNHPATPSATKKKKNGHTEPTSQDHLARLVPANKAVTADLSTDYLLSEKFLRCAWSDRSPDQTDSIEIIPTDDMSSNHSTEDSTLNRLLQQIARPALWDLMRKRMLQVHETSFQQALDSVSLEALEAIVYKQCHEVKKMSLNPSSFSSTEIIEACVSLRQATWLHTLRIISICQVREEAMMAVVLARILHSAKYKLMLGSANWNDLCTLLEPIGKRGVHIDTMIESDGQKVTKKMTENEMVSHPPHKRQKVIAVDEETVPVRVLCSVPFLQQHELLDELCTEQQIYFIERDLPSPIDILVDERNCICVVTGAIFQVEASMRHFVFSLARVQIQFQKCWLVIALFSPPTSDMEDVMNLFLSALVQFRVEMQVLTSFSCEEAGCFVRAVIDQCADIALDDRRILPRMWFDRPFLLEEESQFERFLVSTRIVNNYAAQSLLHKICMEDLFTKDITELKLLVQNVVMDHQLELLWRLVQQGHGLNGAA